MGITLNQRKPGVQARTLNSTTVPAEIRERLEEIVQHARRHIWLCGGLAVAATTMLTLMTLVVVDAVFQFEAFWIRGLLILAGAAVVWMAARWFVLIPLRRDCSQLDVAWALENEHPEMEERLTSTLQLADASGNLNVSRRLISALAEQAQQSIATVDEDEVVQRRLLPAVVAVGACVLIAAVSLIVWPQYLSSSLSNVLSPWNARSLPRLNALILPGDVTIIQGDPVSVEVTGDRELNRSFLEILSEEDVAANHSMAAASDGRQAEFVLSDVTENQTYRIRSAGLYSREYHITVLPKPLIQQFTASLDFPEYTRLPPAFYDDLQQPIEVPVGTRVTLNAMSESSAAATLELNDQSLPADCFPDEESGVSRYQWEFEVTDQLDSQATITLVSEHAVRSEPCYVKIFAAVDLPPTAQILLPNRSPLTVPATQTVPIRFQGNDDFGFNAVRLISSINNNDRSTTELPHVRPDGPVFSGDTSMDLAALNLKADDKLTFWLQATDNRPNRFGGGQTVESEKIEIHIDNSAAPLGQQALRDEQLQVEQLVAAAIDQLRLAAQLTKALATAPDDGKDDEVAAPTDEFSTARKLRKQIDEAKRTLDKLAGGKSQKMFRQQVAAAKDIAEHEVAEAQQQASRIPLADDLQQMRDEAAQTKQTLDQAVEKLEQLQAEIDEQSDALKLAAHLDELARRQNRLAEEMEQQDEQRQDEKQRDIADELQELVESDLDAKSEQFTQRADQAEQLADEANDLGQQQQQLAQFDEAPQQAPIDLESKKQQLFEMIAREQEAIAKETRKLVEQQDLDRDATPKNAPTKAGKDVSQAPQQMEDAANELRKDDPNQAEEAARKALDELVRKDPDGGQQGSLTRQQQRIVEAIDAAKKNQFDKAAAKLQEQIAERAEQLQKKAKELLRQPTEDEENKQAVKEADLKVTEAREKTKAAEKLTKQQLGDQGKPQDGQKEQQPGEQGKPQDGQQEQKPGQDNVRQKQKEAAKALQEAAKSLNKVCKSCRKCSNCNKPGGSKSGGSEPSSQNSATPGQSKPSESKLGQSKPGDSKPGDSKPAANKDGKPNPQQLAKAADKTNQAAQSPSKQTTKEAARELNKLADETAKKADYPYRQQDKAKNPFEKESGKAGKKPNELAGKQPDGKATGSPSEKPLGSNGQGPVGNGTTPDIGLRGGSTSNWTRARKQLRGNVLDDKEANVPEQFRGVVEDYFEELSRQESKPAKPSGGENSEGKKK